MTHLVVHFINSAGLAAILFLMILQSCGVPVPSEVTMPLAGALSAGHHFPLYSVIVLGVVGNMIGGSIAYLLARTFGTPLLTGPGKYIGIRAHHLDIASRWFERHGSLSVVFGRMLPVISTYISFPAGLAKMPYGKFLLSTLVGCTVWCTVLSGIGYALGSTYSHVDAPLELLTIAAVAVIVIVLAAWFIRGRKERSAGAGSAP